MPDLSMQCSDISLSEAMSSVIARHRRSYLRLLSLTAGQGGPEAGRALALLNPKIHIARALEYLARWDLVRQKAEGPGDARQKLLYCMALSIAEARSFTAREVAIIHASVRDFDRNTQIGLKNHSLSETVKRPADTSQKHDASDQLAGMSRSS